jgi:uncharacterized membrane protein YhaH (DUF805 family)
MGNAISICFSKYATFTGRASRSEYWYFYLLYIIAYVAGMILDATAGSGYIQYLFIVPLWLPQIAVGVRRMHDVGKSGWFLLIPIYNLILLCSESNPGSNKYGDSAWKVQ